METISSETLLPVTALQGTTANTLFQVITLIWEGIKSAIVVPLLRGAVYICLTMSLMLLIERVYMGIVIGLVKLFKRKPEKRYKWEPMEDDIELGSSVYPMVLVQIPMYNEKEVLFFNSLPFVFEQTFYFSF